MRRALIVLASLALGACAARSPATTWGWSSWYLRHGFGAESTFERQRGTCLSQMGITDPATVQPRSPQETGFLQCMNAAGWCTQQWACDSAGRRGERSGALLSPGRLRCA